jgi:hypothetical protein
MDYEAISYTVMQSNLEDILAEKGIIGEKI